MTRLILRIYDYLQGHRVLAAVSAAGLVVIMTASIFSISYKEDISDFLPLGSNHQDALKIYQNISGADRIFAIIGSSDKSESAKDSIAAAVYSFAEDVQRRDTAHLVRNLTTGVDMEKVSETMAFAYSNVPYFMTDRDYERFDSLLSDRNYIAKQLQQDKEMLMFPASGLLSDNLQRDPLNLFTPIISRLQQDVAGLKYELYDGCIFSPDMQRAIVMITSPYGSSETEDNSRLMNLLNKSADATSSLHKNINIHLTGGPVIAVENASQIKKDSIMSVTIAVVLILMLLVTSLRSTRNILLIVLSIAFGWLFAMGGLSLIHNNVSVIVIGISSIIIGIAVNYPLHLVIHLRHTPSVRATLHEIAAPLLVGNITTVGAFLALVPLDSVALRDLGIFSSLLLIGTLLFVLLYLPHLVSSKPAVVEAAREQNRRRGLISYIAEMPIEGKRWVVVTICVLTVVFGFFSFQTTFDSNLGNINYMTDEQKNDMEYFKKMLSLPSNTERLYVVSQDSTLDGALNKGLKVQSDINNLISEGLVKGHSGCTDFIPPLAEQERRLARWQAFKSEYAARLTTELNAEACKNGFAEGSFGDFMSIISTDYKPRQVSFFDPIAQTSFAANLSIDSVAHEFAVVDLLDVAPEHIDSVRNIISNECKQQFVFDVKGMNNAIADSLSDNFNYIGCVCGFIVFFFLWLSFGSFELAVISFIPMAVSWVWILGIMGLLGIEFNIVNIILATFIFGQGDDYTIFMTEGSMYEYTYRRKMLSSYRYSIILSALIMFIGIGALIIARHPALRSLAEVTVIGMLVVVLMACVFPPLIYKWLVTAGSSYRSRPVSIRPLLVMGLSASVYFTQLVWIYTVGFVMFCLMKPNEKRKRRFHNLVHRLYRWDLNHIPGVTFNVIDNNKRAFYTPHIVIANHQSMLDSALAMALSPRLIIIANSNASSNGVISRLFKWLDFYTIPMGADINLEVLKTRISEGYSILMFPEGQRNSESSILRFHKGAFKIACDLELDIVPVVIHGANNVLPNGSFQVFKGSLTIVVEPEITLPFDNRPDYSALTKSVNLLFSTRYAAIASGIETALYYKPFVIERYKYMETGIFSSVKRNIRQNDCFSSVVDKALNLSTLRMRNSGYGEQALFMALVHKDVQIQAYETDAKIFSVAVHCTDDISNLRFILVDKYPDDI